MKVLLIGGRARHGKDTLGGYIKEALEEKNLKVCIMQVSLPLKDMARNYFGWDGREETKPRALLQELGTEVIRKKMGKEEFFINRLIEDVEILDNFYDVALVTDVRFPIEYDKTCAAYPDSVKIHIVRPELITELTEEQQKHDTETALDNYNNYDYEIINTTLEKLKEDGRKIVDEVFS